MLISLSPAQQQATQDFTRRIGLIKKARSLQPAVVAALAPEQILSTEILAYELLEHRDGAVPRAIILSEIRVLIKQKNIAWYSVLQLEPVGPTEQFMAVFDHYDYAHKSYRACVTEPQTGKKAVARRCRLAKSQLLYSGGNLEQSLRQAEAGFLFKPGAATSGQGAPGSPEWGY